MEKNKIVQITGKGNRFQGRPKLKVLVTRAKSQAGQLTGLLNGKLFKVIEIPVSEIVPLPLGKTGQKLIRKADEFDWLVFYSSNGVRIFIGHWKKLRKNIQALGKARIACVGEATAKTLKSFGLKPDLVPEDFQQEGLAEEFGKVPLGGKRLLLCRAREGRELLSDFLKKKGARVDSVTLYKNDMPKGSVGKLRILFKKNGGADLITFTSSLALDHFFNSFTSAQRAKWLKDTPIAVIGPVTASSVHKWGMEIVVKPAKYTIAGFANAITAWGRKYKQRVI